MEYLSVAEAKQRQGLCLTLTKDAPGPWSEGAKGILYVKGLNYAPVLQQAGQENAELVEWTNSRSAPTLISDLAPPQSTPEGIILTAERLAPSVPLVPQKPAQRTHMFGLLRELTGYLGLGWCRRLMIIEQAMGGANAKESPLTRDFKHGMDDPVQILARIEEILVLFATTLSEQKKRNKQFLIGDALSALDIYWATFAVLIEPMSEDKCPLGGLRAFYTPSKELGKKCNDQLIEHRDFIYQEFLELPMDF